MDGFFPVANPDFGSRIVAVSETIAHRVMKQMKGAAGCHGRPTSALSPRREMRRLVQSSLSFQSTGQTPVAPGASRLSPIRKPA
jgi:hypothetical protein